MLTLAGDILNWTAAGIVFPLMFLPAAALIAHGRGRSTALWFVGVAAIIAAGLTFAALAPALRITPPVQALLVYFTIVAALGGAIFLAGGPAGAIAFLSPLLDRFVRTTGRTVMWLILVMAGVQFAIVVLRYVFGVNFIFMQESITYMHGAVFLLAGGYALLTDDHVRVDIFYRDAPPKHKALVDFLGTYFLLFPVCLLLLWTASPYVGVSWSVTEGSAESSGIQGVYLLKSLVPAFAILLAMAGFTNAARAGDILKAGA
ncbi:TRAP dicarboxylate transporter, DctQ subunit, unknown substrate 6 [hydrothermal vent metagenome]|uniref:Tripartite ATP-independent periplasmic transporters DctQ component domain-containing protein n=1 Tax=hydrothermal vent metagenome TaxID=652676 RepID=A0A3B0RXH6_9ZZZZ